VTVNTTAECPRTDCNIYWEGKKIIHKAKFRWPTQKLLRHSNFPSFSCGPLETWCAHFQNHCTRPQDVKTYWQPLRTLHFNIWHSQSKPTWQTAATSTSFVYTYSKWKQLLNSNHLRKTKQPALNLPTTEQQASTECYTKRKETQNHSSPQI